jgi:uncharacterized protein (TIGR02246 family)
MALATDDTIEILQLYARYNTAIDTGDAETFGGCFVPDGVFDNGMGVVEGRPDIAAFARQTHAGMPGLRHNATNVVVDGEGDEATGSAFLIGYLVDGGYKVIVTGRYEDALSKTAEGWRFTKRVFRADA